MLKDRLLTRRHALGLGLATLAGGCVLVKGRANPQTQYNQALGDPERDFTVAGEASLKERAAAKGLIYGAAGDYASLPSDAQLRERFAQECAILVPAIFELKWRGLRPSPDGFDFTQGDWLAEFARTHGMLFRGHTLVWNQDLPQWFDSTVNRRNARQILLKHITTVVGHYADRIHSWDVVNEAVWPEDNQPHGLRRSPWLQFLGQNYIDLAFRAAAEADPQALLVYNGDQLDHDTPEDEARRVATLKLLERLKSQGTPVQALGIQAHLQADKPLNPKKLRAFLRDVADLGLKILITELDVKDNNLPKNITVRDRIVAGVYEDYLSVMLDEPAVIAVLTWGLSDKNSWLANFPREDKAPVRPLPLDTQLKRKLAWNAIARAFDKAPKR